MKVLYLAGGCFWGLEKYLSHIPGVIATSVGYSNGLTKHPSYEDICKKDTGYAETVKVEYDPTKISLTFLLEQFYQVIDPTSLNRQGNDVGTQYRTGIYFTNDSDKEIIEGSIALLQESLECPIMIEVKPLANYYSAEEYHQNYLEKNPHGYCHISSVNLEAAKQAVDSVTVYRGKSKNQLKESLSPMQFEVTQNAATEPPFSNQYNNNFRKGIYVDITTGEPLFVSTDKFESGCGWPSFSKPIDDDLIVELPDYTHGRERLEVRSKNGNAHLGHVFNDGSNDQGGLRYCINSASLRFIPKDQMESEGYGYLLAVFRQEQGK